MNLHFAQSNRTPLTTDEWIARLMDTNFQESVLDGTVDLSAYTPVSQKFFSVLKQEENIGDDVTFQYSFKDFESFVRGADKKTSVSPSGRHYGHYKTLQALANPQFYYIYRLLATVMKYGIVLDRYKQKVTTLIAKEDNMPKIHRLGPIHLVEVELLAIYTSRWCKKLVGYAEKKKLLEEGQYGGRNNRQAQSEVFNKVLSFGLGMLMIKPYTYVDEDLKANVDRELVPLGVLENRTYGAPPLSLAPIWKKQPRPNISM